MMLNLIYELSDVCFIILVIYYLLIVEVSSFSLCPHVKLNIDDCILAHEVLHPVPTVKLLLTIHR